MTKHSSVCVLMVNVWVMGVLVRHFRVDMSVNMWFMAIPRKAVNVLMVFIVRMFVLMIQRLVMMRMLMEFCKVYPDSSCHQ